jgi:hypothetical protein
MCLCFVAVCSCIPDFRLQLLVGVLQARTEDGKWKITESHTHLDCRLTGCCVRAAPFMTLTPAEHQVRLQVQPSYGGIAAVGRSQATSSRAGLLLPVWRAYFQDVNCPLLLSQPPSKLLLQLQSLRLCVQYKCIHPHNEQNKER